MYNPPFYHSMPFSFFFVQLMFLGVDDKKEEQSTALDETPPN